MYGVLDYALDASARCLAHSARCLAHSFTVHTHYEVAPPYSPFLPYISMMCPGIAVFNTSDSLVAVDIRLDTDRSSCGLFSMEFTATSDLHPMSHVTVDDIADETVAASESAVPSTNSSPSSSALAVLEEQPTPKDATNTPPAEPRVFRERNLSWGKENRLEFTASVESPDGSDQHPSVHGFDSGMAVPKSANESFDDTVVDLKASQSTTSNVVKLTPTALCGTCDSLDSTTVLQSSGESEEQSAKFEYPRLTIVPPQLFDTGAGLNTGMYPSFGWSMLPGHAATSSCSSLSSPVILQNDAQCFTYSVRRYSSAATNADVEGNR